MVNNIVDIQAYSFEPDACLDEEHKDVHRSSCVLVDAPEWYCDNFGSGVEGCGKIRTTNFIGVFRCSLAYLWASLLS